MRNKQKEFTVSIKEHGKYHNATLSFSEKTLRIAFAKDEKPSRSIPLVKITNISQNTEAFSFNFHSHIHFTAPSKSLATEIIELLKESVEQAKKVDEDETDRYYDKLYTINPHAPVTRFLVLANVLFFIFVYSFERLNILSPGNQALIKWGADYAVKTSNGESWRLLSCAFIHFGILHLTLNMLCLHYAGNLVERLYGSHFFIIIYFFSALAGSLGSLFWKGGSFVGGGASGAIFGIIGALGAMLILRRKYVPLGVFLPLKSTTISFIGLNILIGSLIPQIDNAAHIGGVLGGFLAGLLLTRPLDYEVRPKLFLPKLIIASVMLSAIIFFTWNPILSNSRKDAHCRSVYKGLESRIKRQQALTNYLMSAPIQSVYQLKRNKQQLKSLSSSWHRAALSLAEDQLPGRPLDTNKYRRMRIFCKKRSQDLNNRLQQLTDAYPRIPLRPQYPPMLKRPSTDK
ncbi:MAG: rhomboid family intramembrane serine protease [Lentisphaeraceae bacterium]|nr:rhomboid family intramembrane serine protease [Lentisphaeraceae bacterium]